AIEQGDPDEGERPPAPRGEADGDECPGPERRQAGRDVTTGTGNHARRSRSQQGAAGARTRAPAAWTERSETECRGAERGMLRVRWRRRGGLDLEDEVIRVAPPPVLAGLVGPDDRVAHAVEVGRGVPARGGI